MSIAALLQAVQTRLRSAAILNDATGTFVGIQNNGQPPPVFGQVYYAIWWNKTNQRLGFSDDGQQDREYAVTVTITGKFGVIPTDRQGRTVATLAASGGQAPLNLYLLDLAEYLASDAPKVIHDNYANVMNVANALIIGTPEYVAIHGGAANTNGFLEPLLVLDYGPVTDRPASWIGAKNVNAGDIMSVDVHFGKARRVTKADATDA